MTGCWAHGIILVSGAAGPRTAWSYQDDDQVRPAERHVQKMLDELGRALASAIASSSDVTEAVAKIRKEGYSLSLLLNCEHAESAGAQVALPAPSGQSAGTETPAFRLDGTDVAWLRSVGIDATRPAPRRRGS